MHNPNFGDFSDDAKAALQASPDYFLTWYTVKSVGLVIFACGLAYLLGKEHGKRRSR